MKCPNCDTVNPDDAKFCRTCGINLQEDNIFDDGEEEIVHTPTVENNVNYQQTNSNTGNNNVSSDWGLCCACLFIIFIIFALISIF